MCSDCKNAPDADITSEQVSEWIKALRSGEYRQLGGNLATVTSSGPKYCCLGVYGVLNGGRLRKDNFSGLVFGGSPDSASYLASSLMAFETQVMFSRLNDEFQWSFAEIADFAEGLPFEAFYSPTWMNDDRTEAFLVAFRAMRRIKMRESGDQ